jgi:ParB-like chromosome segregation protein Spo0J
MGFDINDRKQHPVNNVIWVEAELVQANDYNPNSVAAPEMELLELSIRSDGFTQPIVVWKTDDGIYEVVDGFHRHKVGEKIGMKFLPIVIINSDRIERGDRIASTIRHNRARGKHRIDSMSEIVQELSRRNWSEKKIGMELGMDPDEVLRLKQITGLAELFSDRDFSEAWEA